MNTADEAHPGIDCRTGPVQSEDLTTEIDRHGYVVVDLLDRVHVESLKVAMSSLVGAVDSPFYASSAHGDRVTATDVHHLVESVLQPAIDGLIRGFEIFLAAFLTKSPDTFGPVEFHQDWTYVDEREHRSLVVWVPLVDTNEVNGALCVVSGSHLWTSDIRPSGVELSTRHLQRELGTLASTLFMSAGQAVVYDPRLIHGSWPNSSSEARPAVAAALAPDGVPLLHFQVVDGSRLQGWRIDRSYFTQEDFGSAPRSGIPMEPWTDYVSPNLMKDCVATAQLNPDT